MASGYSWGGGRSRCFTFWQEFQKCYAESNNPNAECRPQSNDYLECLHHPKEIERTQAVQTEYFRKMEQEAKERAKENHKAGVVSPAGVPAGVGPIKGEPGS